MLKPQAAWWQPQVVLRGKDLESLTHVKPLPVSRSPEVASLGTGHSSLSVDMPKAWDALRRCLPCPAQPCSPCKGLLQHHSPFSSRPQPFPDGSSHGPHSASLLLSLSGNGPQSPPSCCGHSYSITLGLSRAPSPIYDRIVEGYSSTYFTYGSGCVNQISV